jgi:phosphate:Na+ symporter
MDIKEVRSKTAVMADKAYEMVGLIEKGFMENRSEPLSAAMRTEDSINEMEKGLTKDILELSASPVTEKEKRELVTLEQIVETLERMGDEAAGLIERIEIKVAEKLLFSDAGVAQFNETYHAMKRSVEMMREFLDSKDKTLKERVIDNGFHVKELVERYRKEHTERLLKGGCTLMGANMYFDMLDFTGNLARHSSTIVKLFEK